LSAPCAIALCEGSATESRVSALAKRMDVMAPPRRFLPGIVMLAAYEIM